MIEFLRLEKIEFAGVKGHVLSDLVLRMFEDFTELSNVFQSRSDDPLDINNTVSVQCVMYIQYRSFSTSSLDYLKCTKQSGRDVNKYLQGLALFPGSHALECRH